MIIQGDCITELKKMPDNMVDVAFYDPPYNIKKKYDGYSDNLSPEEYLAWMTEVYNECNRVARNGVIVYIGGKLLKMFINIFPDNAHTIIVEKRAAGVFSGNYMLQYHAMLSTVKPVIKCKDLWNDIRLPGEGYFFREPRYDHPGLTGLELTKRVLHHFTVEDDMVLDPFFGTGTTAIAAKSMSRHWIGIEQSSKYIETANRRLNDE